MRIKRLCTLLLLLVLSACSSSDDDGPSVDNPPADDPVAGPDCLGDIAADGTTYCVDPGTQTVTATRADGTINWTKVLTDSDRTIDTLVLVDGQPWLVADSGSKVGQVVLDQDYVSYYTIELDSGGFIQTSPSYNYDYQRGENTLLAIGMGDSAYIVTDVYELIDGADRALDDSWQFIGASLSRIRFISSRTSSGDDYTYLKISAQRLYTDQHVQTLARTIGEHVFVERNEATERLLADTLLPTTSDPTRALLGGKPHESVTPFLLAALRGDGLDQHARQVLALGELVRATASETVVIQSNATEEVPPHGTDTDVLEEIDYVCMDGGELALERTEKVTYNSGGFSKTEIHENYHYTDCHVTASEGDPLLSSGSYRLDGDFIYDDLDDVAFQNYTHTRVSHEWQQLSLDSPEQRSSVTTAQTVRDNELIVNPPNPSIATTSITLHEERIDGEVTLSITEGDYSRSLANPYGETQPYVRITGNGTITATETGNQAITVSIDPAIEARIDFTNVDNSSPPNVLSTGHLLVSAADGSTMSVTAVETPAPYTGSPPWNASASFDYLVTDDDAVLQESKNLNSLDIPISLP